MLSDGSQKREILRFLQVAAMLWCCLGIFAPEIGRSADKRLVNIRGGTGSHSVPSETRSFGSCFSWEEIAPVSPVERPFFESEHDGAEAELGADSPLDGLTVAIDAGHGGDSHPRVVNGWEPGARSPFFDVFQVSDFAFNYEATETIANLLRKRGATVQLFRYPTPGGEGFDTKGKGRRASGSDIFISLHHNSAPGFAQGSEVFTPVSPQLNDRRLAYAIQDELVRQIWNGNKSFDRGVKSANFDVLVGAVEAKIPAVVLVESFFIHNEESIQDLIQRREKSSVAVADGVTQYWLSQGLR